MEGVPLRLRTLEPAFLFRVKRAYRLAINAETEWAGLWWGRIGRLQAPVHKALVAETDDDLREIFADPISSDLFYGVDNLSRTLFGADSVNHATVCAFSEGSRNDLIALAGVLNATQAGDNTAFDVDRFLQKLDSRLNQYVDFPTPFRGELGLETSRGIASYRAVQALYQTWRILELLHSCEEKSVVEIGPGMGRAAYYAFRAGIIDYVTVDLPMGIVAQACFLGAVLGPEKIWLPGDADELARGRIKLLFASTKPNKRFTLAVNVDSLTEMPLNVALQYAGWIKRYAGAFLSINHCENLFSAGEIAVQSGLLHSTRKPYPMRRGYFEEVFNSSGRQTSSHSIMPILGYEWVRVKAGSRLARRALRKLKRKIHRSKLQQTTEGK